MQVKMLEQTHYGKTLFPDDVVKVDNETGLRWIGNGIAEVVESDDTIESADVSETVDDGTYASKDAKALYALCKERNIDAEARKSKEHYIELLEAADKAATGE